MRKVFPLRAFVLFVFVSGAVLATFLLWGDAIDGWTKSALERAGDNRAIVAGVLFAVLASDILLPVPSSLACTFCGLLLGPWLGFAVSFGAMTASGALGYAIGRFLSGRAEKLIGASDMAALEAFERRAGPWMLLALRPVPILAEASAVFAGIGRIPVASAALQLVLGNAAVSLVYVIVGAFFAEYERGSWLAFLAAIVVSGVFFAVRPAIQPDERSKMA